MAWRRFSAPELSHGLWTGLWAALVAVVTIVVVQTLTADETPAGYRILFRLVGTAYVACGLIAWRRRPDSRSGLLMTATGFLLFCEPLLDGFGPLGDLTEDVWSITIVWLLLTMLSGGRLISRVDKTLVGLFVLLQFNWFAVLLGVLSLGVVALYPFAKRFTDWPQFFLGLAFSWGALMGWAGIFGSLSFSAFLLYLASVVWTIGYDTIYAHQDKEDDELIGVRSTARLFGERTRLALVGLYGLTLVLMFLSFALAGVGLLAFVGLLIAAGMFAWQIRALDINDGAQCLALFKSNTRVGLIIFLGLFVSLLFAIP